MKIVRAIEVSLLLMIMSVVITSCGPSKAELIEQSSKKKPFWTKRHENWLEEEKTFIFIGRSEGADSKLKSRKNSLANAFSHFSNYFGVTVSSEFTEKTKDESGDLNYEIDLFSEHKGTRVKVKRYNVKDFYYEVNKVDKKKVFASMIMVEVPKDEMTRIERELKPGLKQAEWIKKIKESTSKMFEDTEKFKGKKVAIGGVTDNQKKVTELSLFIAEQVEMVMIVDLSVSGSDVIAMKELKDEMKSWRLGVKGLVNEENSTQAGKLLGVDVFCFGGYTILGDTINLNLKMIESDTGKILAGTSLVLDADEKLIELSKKYIDSKETVSKSTSKEMDEKDADEKDTEKPEVKVTDAKTADIMVELWSDKEEFNDGDKVKFFVKTDKDCYLSLIHVNARGELTMLFPNYYAPSNFVKGGTVYSIPSDDAGFDFIASEPYGYEIVRAIATKVPQVDIKEAMDMKALSAGKNLFASTNRISEENPFGSFITETSAVTRGISIKAKKAKKGEWAEAVIKIKIKR